MKLIDIGIDENGELSLGKTKLYGGSFFNPYPSPKIILTKEEAIERGFDPELKKGKGYYVKVDSRRVPIDIK